METPETSWRLGRRPALDGLRGLAVLLVVLSHLHSPWLGGAAGDAGVTIFFTLSGFLIATLLYEELEATGTVRLRRFYERRARRLLPALVAVVLVSVIATVVTGIDFVTWPEVVGALTYSTNVIGMFVTIPTDGMLHHTWSLVIEEQFYLVWPLVTLVLWRRPRTLLALACAGIIWAATERVMLLFTDADLARVIYSIPMRIDGILIGCGLALLLRRRSAPPALGGAGGALLLMGLLALAPVAMTLVFGLSVIALGTAIVITAILVDGGPAWLAWRPLQELGRVSYGLYLWHHVVLIFSDRALGFEDNWIATALVVLPASAILTLLSWRYIEQPWLQHGTAARPRPEVASPAAARPSLSSELLT